MAADDITEDFDEDLDVDDIDEEDIAEDFVDDDDDEEEIEVVDDDALEGDAVDDDEDDDFDDDDEDDDEDDEEADRDEALEELEAAELEIEDDPETLLVDEAAEIREMRRDELGIGGSAREQSADEFVCTECFLVKKVSQLANKKRRVCRDCI